MRCWQAALASAPHGSLTWTAPDWMDSLEPGQRVLVPVGRTVRLAVLESCSDAPPEGLPKGVTLRDVIWPLDPAPLLDAAYLDFARTLAARVSAPLGRILETLLPPGLRSPKAAFEVLHEDFPNRLAPSRLAALPDARRQTLWDLWQSGRMRVRPATDLARSLDWCWLEKDPPWPVRPGAARQLQVLETLLERGPMPRKALTSALGEGGARALNLLADRGLVGVGRPPEQHPAGDGDGNAPGLEDMEPTEAQGRALADLAPLLDAGELRVSMVHGVTGSGKTLVYLRLAERAMSAGRDVLLLAPEVALAQALARAARQALPGLETRLYHGYLPPGHREEIFARAADAGRGPMLVAGTRSALFLPLRDPGLVVLDEEHDASFKQDEGLAYQAKELAWYRAGQWMALLLLGSATPDVKTFHAAETGGIGRVSLPARVGGRPLPDLALADMRAAGPDDPLAPEAEAALAGAMAAGDQAIILLNRRGYAPVMYCTGCEAPAKCPNCDIGLVYHKARERLVCHYCGLAEPFPTVCQGCGGTTFVPMGLGTERLEETLSRLVPDDAALLRVDRDTTRRPGRLEAMLDDFARGRARVLVGTQMLSKGHHFPGVTLVVAAEADLGLNLPDYRAAERTFQLLVQVAGRAGRGERPGRVLIQTRNPDHYCWQYVLDGDYEGFYAREVALRAKYGYPPFSKLGLMRLSFPAGWDRGRDRVMELVGVLGRAGTRRGVRVLGPAPSPLSLLRGRLRYQCLLKAPDWPAIRDLYAEARACLSGERKIRIGLDLDPVNML